VKEMPKGNKDIPEFFDHAICAACEGLCCKGNSCLASPSDFGNTSEEVKKNLKEALQSGLWIVDWWENDCPGIPKKATGYFVRPRGIRDDPDKIFYPSWGGTCLFLMEDGCSLPDEARPLGGRTVEPKPGGIDHCIQHANAKKYNEKPTFAKMWFPYNEFFIFLRYSSIKLTTT
jgi:hypothetical protein